MSSGVGDSRARLLSIEGVDGSGKSTQVRAVSAALQQHGIDARPVVVEAFGARTVNLLAERMTGDRHAYHPLIPADLREWVFACDVAYFSRTTIEPLLESGVTVVQDRGPLSYRVSAEMYGGYTDWVERVHQLFVRPWRTYVLDLPRAQAAKRLARRTGTTRQTDESDDVIDRMAEALTAAARTEPNIVLVDARAKPDVVTARIVQDWLTATAATPPSNSHRREEQTHG